MLISGTLNAYKARLHTPSHIQMLPVQYFSPTWLGLTNNRGVEGEDTHTGVFLSETAMLWRLLLVGCKRLMNIRPIKLEIRVLLSLTLFGH